MNNIGSYIATFLSQVFVGLFIGLCWNNSMTELGFPNLSMIGAIALWFGILVPYFVLAYIAANLSRNLSTGVIVATTETGTVQSRDLPKESENEKDEEK
jgi:membrane associated rhomboid family serine protease